MAKGVVIPIALSILVMMLLLQNVNTGAIMVHSSSSSFSSTDCDGMNCASGQSCSVSFSGIGDNSTKVRFCSDLAGNYHKEEIVTTLTGNLQCITNTTDVNGHVTTKKNCSQLSSKELEQRQEAWEKQMNIVKAGGENLNGLLESEQRAWDKHQEAMDRAFMEHERAMEQAIRERDRAWEMHQRAIDRQLERLANFRM